MIGLVEREMSRLRRGVIFVHHRLAHALRNDTPAAYFFLILAPRDVVEDVVLGVNEVLLADF